MEAKSLAHALTLTAGKFGDRPALMLPIKEGFQTVTYAEFLKKVQGYSQALQSLGVAKGDKVVIQSENCGEWMYFDYACSSLGAIVVAIYPTLPADQTQYIVTDCGAKIAFAGSKDHLAKMTPLDSVKVLPLTGEGSLDAMASESSVDNAEWNARLEQVHPEDIYTFIYTSGTTGHPKGAILDHRAFLTVTKHAVPYLDLSEQDLFFSFLPFSHVFERVVIHLVVGTGIGFAINNNLARLAPDIPKVRPTAMTAVPRFLESFRERVLDNVAKQKPIRQKLFHLALAQGVAKAQGRPAPLYPVLDKLVGAKIRERLGGRFRFFVAGGAALPKHVAEFYLGLGINVLQGYGLTETSGGSCVNHPTRNRYETVGEPIGVEMKIAEDGEILFRGPTVMRGYYNLPEETAQAIDADGWFHTGDIGEMDGKQLRITDRKKDLIVLGNGKNVAPQPLENKIKESKFINEAVVLGDGMDHCIALIVPNADAVRAELSLPEHQSLQGNEDARKLIKREIDAANKTFAHFEMIKKFAVIDAVFSIETGELTPTLKVKRKVIKERYAREIEELRG